MRLLIALALLLAGCAGVTESLNRINGTAPETGDCRVDIIDRETGQVYRSTPVRGPFSIGFGQGANQPRRVDIRAYCDGKMTKELRRIEMGSIGTTELGSIRP